MSILKSLIPLPVWLLVASTAGVAAEAQLPPFPMLMVAEYRSDKHPVIAAKGKKPVIMIRGKSKILSENATLLPRPGTGYSQTAQLDVKITDRVRFPERNPNGPQLWGEEINTITTIIADADLADCYVAIIGFHEDSLHDPEAVDSTQIFIQEVGVLRAGQPVRLNLDWKIRLPVRTTSASPTNSYTDLPDVMPPDTQVHTFWQLYSGGKEVRTTTPPYAHEFLYSREQASHREAVAVWRQENRRGDRPAQPYLQIPPLLDNPEGLPPSTSATLHVAKNGTVTEVILDQPFPEDVQARLITTLRAWLFLPEIKNGATTPAQVRIPLQF